MKAEKLGQLLQRYPDTNVSVSLGLNRVKLYVSSDRKHIMITGGKNHKEILSLGYMEILSDTST